MNNPAQHTDNEIIARAKQSELIANYLTETPDGDCFYIQSYAEEAFLLVQRIDGCLQHLGMYASMREAQAHLWRLMEPEQNAAIA